MGAERTFELSTSVALPMYVFGGLRVRWVKGEGAWVKNHPQKTAEIPNFWIAAQGPILYTIFRWKKMRKNLGSLTRPFPFPVKGDEHVKGSSSAHA